MKKTFTAAIFGTPDSNGDVLVPGSLSMESKVFLSYDFREPKVEINKDDCKMEDNELKVTHSIPEIYMGCVPAIGFQVMKSVPNEHGGRNITEMKLHEISLIALANNVDPHIKPLKDQ